jgi:Glycine-zipper domain
MLRRGMTLLLLGLLSACAVVPTGPHVMVLPNVGKPFDQFQVDDVVCRHYAQQQLGITPGEASTQSTAQSAALGTILGAAAGAAIGAAGNVGTGAAIGAGSGLLLGSASGAQAAFASAATLQWRYDVAYTQCMSAKSHLVPGAASPGRALPRRHPRGSSPRQAHHPTEGYASRSDCHRDSCPPPLDHSLFLPAGESCA